MAPAADATITSDAITLLSDFYTYSDLAAHLRAIPEAARVLGLPDGVGTEYASLVRELEQKTLITLEDLDRLGLYPTTETAVEVSVNGTLIELPEHCGESSIHALPDWGSPTTEEIRMENTTEHSENRQRHNGLDHPVDAEDVDSSPGFFAFYVRPYFGYAATFVAGAVCGAIGARYIGTPSESIELSA